MHISQNEIKRKIGGNLVTQTQHILDSSFGGGGGVIVCVYAQCGVPMVAS